MVATLSACGDQYNEVSHIVYSVSWVDTVEVKLSPREALQYFYRGKGFTLREENPGTDLNKYWI